MLSYHEKLMLQGYPDLEKICRQLGFNIAVEVEEPEDAIKGEAYYTAKLILESDSHDSQRQAMKDLEKRAVEMVTSIAKANSPMEQRSHALRT